jgi:hypothetical protein
MRIPVASLAAVLLVACPAMAQKAGKRVVFSRWQAEGLPKGAVLRFQKGARAAVKQAGFANTPRSVLKSIGASKPHLLTCKGDGCQRELGVNAGARLCLDISVEGLGGTFLMTVRVLATARPHRAVKAAGKCEVCSVAEAVKKLGGILRKALLDASGPAKLPRPPLPRPVVPRIARVARPARTGPPNRGGDVSVRKRRRANPGPALKLSGWIVGSVGLAAVIAGSVLVGLHGRGSCASGSECENVYKTRTPGIVTLAVGGAALAAAVTLYVVGVKKERKAGPGEPAGSGRPEQPRFGLTLGVVSGAAVVMASGRF